MNKPAPEWLWFWSRSVVPILLISVTLSAAAGPLEFHRGQPAYVVAKPETALETRVTDRLTNYLASVLRADVKVVPDAQTLPQNVPAIVLLCGQANSSLNLSAPTNNAESFALETRQLDGRSVVLARGNSDRGLKRAVQRLIIASEQRNPGLIIPELHVAESPWIPEREWTICPWVPEYVRGVFVNPDADRRLNIWLYGPEQTARYVDMFDAFGFSGCQLMETCYSYAAMGSPEAFQARQRQFAESVRKNGQDLTLWVWAAQFNGFNWRDRDVTYAPAAGNTAYEDPKVRACFEKYYNHYAQLAPLVDRLMAHFYDPGALTNRADIFNYMRLLREKFRAKNPGVKFAVDFWSAGSSAEYMQQLIDNGFRDALLLEMSLPHIYPPGKREDLHRSAQSHNLQLGVWGWYTTEYETDQMPMMHVNAQLLKAFYQQIKTGVHQVHPVTYWSEMEAYHLNNIFTMYAASQLLWNPDRDPHQVLAEIAEGIWGPRNGPKILEALELIQDTRSGPAWETFWWTLPKYRLGTTNATADLARAEQVLKNLENLNTDREFVPKFPLPFPPDTFVELMIPHIRQIRQFAQFRVDVDAIRDAARNGTGKEELTRMAVAAWKPIPEYNTWIGTFGQPEATMQEKVLAELSKELGISITPPAWLPARDADRLLQALRNGQKNRREVWKFRPADQTLWSEFFWPREKGVQRMNKLLDDGVIVPAGNGLFQLANPETP